MVCNNQLVCFYSDQRDPLYGQKLVHQVNNDSQTWGHVVEVVHYSDSSYRPGMTITSKLPTDEYIVTYQFYGASKIISPSVSSRGYLKCWVVSFAAYYKISADPLDFISGALIIAEDGYVPSSSPYNTITPDGALVARAASSSEIFLTHCSYSRN